MSMEKARNYLFLGVIALMIAKFLALFFVPLMFLLVICLALLGASSVFTRRFRRW